MSQHQLFVEKYQQMHRLVTVGMHADILYVGAENWPLPIPIVKGKDGWYFDTEGARVKSWLAESAENELSAINVCLAIVAAQNEYKAQLHDGDKVNQYAQRFTSSDGKHDGLYWNAAGIGAQEPAWDRGWRWPSYSGRAGPRRRPAQAVSRLLSTESSPRRVRTRPAAPKDYLDDGKLTKGFAVVAYPARYRVSGVTTFIVNQDGIVYQKGPGSRHGENRVRRCASTIPTNSWIPAN